MDTVGNGAIVAADISLEYYFAATAENFIFFPAGDFLRSTVKTGNMPIFVYRKYSFGDAV
jgi:hypothetical protein